jgi:hypothetical protein
MCNAARLLTRTMANGGKCSRPIHLPEVPVISYDVGFLRVRTVVLRVTITDFRFNVAAIDGKASIIIALLEAPGSVRSQCVTSSSDCYSPRVAFTMRLPSLVSQCKIAKTMQRLIDCHSCIHKLDKTSHIISDLIYERDCNEESGT